MSVGNLLSRRQKIFAIRREEMYLDMILSIFLRHAATADQHTRNLLETLSLVGRVPLLFSVTGLMRGLLL